MTESKTPVLNDAQNAVLETYANGDFAHLIECPTKEALDVELENCGDGLLRFLMVELADQEDCFGLEEAVRRIKSAIEDLEGAMAGVQARETLPAVPRPATGTA